MKRILTRKPFSSMMGLTLLETMFAIAIGALVLIGAVTFFISTKQSANVSKTVSDMNSIVGAMEQYITGGSSGANVTSATILSNAGLIPSPLNDAWGQAYTIVGAASSVTITIPGIGGTSDKNCSAILSMVNPTVNTSITSGITATVCAFTYTL